MKFELLSDEDLLVLLKSGDHDAFRQIYLRYWKQLFCVAYKKTHNKELAEEITQNLFLSLWEKRETANINKLNHYLFSALRYTVINYIKAQMVQEKYVVYKTSNPNAEINNTDQRALLHDLSFAVEKGMALLPKKTKQVFQLSRYQNLSVKQISNDMNLSEKAVEYHITQSIKLLRVYLKDFLLLCLLFAHNI